MRFQRKRVAIIGGILAVFVLAVGIFAGVVNKQNDASAVSSTANISDDGWTGSLNGWKTKYFKMTVSEPAINRKRAWCGDLAGVSPNGNYKLKTVTVNENSDDKVKYLFNAMYYGEAGGYSDVIIHQVIHSILNNDDIAHNLKLYTKATTSSLPNKNNMKIYYTDPNDWSLSSHGRQGGYWQRIFTYTYEERSEMELEIAKYWFDSLDSEYQDISNKGTDKDYYPDFIAVKVENAEGGQILNADGTPNTELTNSSTNYIKLYRSDGYTKRFSGLQDGQSFRITEYFAESGMDQDSVTGTWSYKNSPVEYENAQHTSCTSVSKYKVKCAVANKEAEYHDTRLYLTKVWDDRGYEDLRTSSYSFGIKAFAGDNDVTDQIGEGKLKNRYTVRVGDDSYEGSGYISDLVDQIDGVEVKYYVAEFGLPEGVFKATCETEKKNIDGVEYCLATKRNSDDGREDLEVTYTNAPEFINKTVTKTWNDGRGAIYARPKVLFYDIYRNGEKYTSTGIWNPCFSGFGHIENCTDDDQWSLEVSLPKYYKTANGAYVEADYTVQETDYDWDGIGQGGLSQKYVIENDGLVMKNTAKTNIPVMKCWVDKDETHRPDSLTFNLYREGETEIQGTLVLTADDEDENGCWVGSFDDLQAYDKDTGEAITYTVEEDISEVDNYEAEEFGVCTVDIAERAAAKGKDEDIDTSCSFTNVELIDIPVVKVWEEDKKEDRPGSIEVSLLCGDDVLDTVTLSEANNLDGDNTWEYTWKNRRVDECEQGYSVAENINIPGYATKITGNAEDGFVITNTKTLDEIMTWGSLGAGSFGVIAAGFFVAKRKLFARY